MHALGSRTTGHLVLAIAAAAALALAAPVASALASGSISGTAYAGPGTTTPVAGVSVVVRPVGDPNSAAGATTQTAADGGYTATGLAPGQYDVQFRTFRLAPGLTSATDIQDGDYLPQYFDLATTLGAATAVSVADGTDTPGIDAHLQLGGSITGTVTDAAGHLLSGRRVQTVQEPHRWTLTDAAGHYELWGLPSGTYTVGATVGVFSLRSDSAGVTQGATTTGVDLHQPAGGRIAGRVTDAGGFPLKGVAVAAATPNGDVLRYTDAHGRYTLDGLPAGSYPVRFFAKGYSDQWYRGASSAAAAHKVAVSAGATTKGIDARLVDPSAPVTPFSIVKRSTSPTRVRVTAWVPGPGTVRAEAVARAGGHRLGARRDAHTARHAGKVVLSLRLSPAARTARARGHDVRVSVRLRYRPEGGPTTTRRTALTVRGQHRR